MLRALRGHALPGPHSPISHGHSPISHSPISHSPTSHSPISHSPISHIPIKHSHGPISHSRGLTKTHPSTVPRFYPPHFNRSHLGANLIRRSYSTHASESLQQHNQEFQQQLMGKYAVYVLSREKRYSSAIKGLGGMEDASKTWCNECNQLNVDLKLCIDFVHEVPGDYSSLEQRISTDGKVALLVVDMLVHEGKLPAAKRLLQDLERFPPPLRLQAKLYIAQIHFHEQRAQEARQIAFELLADEEASESSLLMRGVLDLLTLDRPDDPPFYMDVPQMNEVLTSLDRVMRRHSLVCDFMRLIKRWAVPLWEQMNIDNHKSNKRGSSDDVEARFDGGNHLSLLLHPFILTLAKLEQVQSEMFENQFSLLRRDILFSRSDEAAASLAAEDDTIASAIAHQTMFNQASWAETTEEKEIVDQLHSEVQNFIKQKGTDPSRLSRALLHLAMYRPLSHIEGFEAMGQWDMGLFDNELQEVLRVHVFDPMQQRRLVESAVEVSPISAQNSRVSEFYTTHIFPMWRSTGRELWPSSIRLSLSMYYGKSLTDSEEAASKVENVLIAGCGSCHEVAMLRLAHPEAKIAALDLSKASVGYGMKRMKDLGLDDNVNYYLGDLELLGDAPPAPFEAGFDMITATGVLHHLTNPMVGWRNLVEWLKPGGIMSLGLYSRLARIPCAQLRSEVAQKMSFTPPLFGKLSGSDFVAMVRQPTPDELRLIRQFVLSSPQYGTLAKKSMGEFKDMLCHPQERTYSLPELQGVLDHLGLEFLGFMLDDDQEIRAQYASRFKEDKHMDNLLNWDKFEQEKPWTFSGMYFFHCRKMDKKQQQELYNKRQTSVTEENNRKQEGDDFDWEHENNPAEEQDSREAEVKEVNR